MAFQRVCSLDEVWEGEMQVFTLAGEDVLVVNAGEGVVRAFDAICPHQDTALIDGTLEGRILTCPAHLWQFDVATGEGVNPTGCRMKQYSTRLEGDDILIDLQSPIPAIHAPAAARS
jgi:toluene monooxygenase system ferredoxin subunit